MKFVNIPRCVSNSHPTIYNDGVQSEYNKLDYISMNKLTNVHYINNLKHNFQLFFIDHEMIDLNNVFTYL